MAPPSIKLKMGHPAFMEIKIKFPGHVTSGGLPNPDGLIGQTWVATNHSMTTAHGDVYVLAHVTETEVSGSLIDIMFTRSTDGGETWTHAMPVHDDTAPTLGWQWFGTMSVAPNGRIDVIWNDTRNYTQFPNGNMVELFYTYSLDAGDTWAPNEPVSPVFDSHVGWPAGALQRKLGDYYTMVSDNLGANVAYAATFNGEQDVYFLRIGPWDCNGNEIDDELDVASATSSDCNGNSVPDECEYRVDIDGDGLTTLSDHADFVTKLLGPDQLFNRKSQIDNRQLSCFELFDADHDGHIDLTDFAYLQRVYEYEIQAGGGGPD